MKGTEGVLQKRNTKCYFFLDEHIRYWLQSDNTVKEVRNQFGSKLLITLAQAQTFRVCTLAHLKVGHTHEDVDAIFSIVSSFLRTAQNIETPRDLQRLISDRVAPIFTKKNLDFDISIVDVVTLK